MGHATWDMQHGTYDMGHGTQKNVLQIFEACSGTSMILEQELQSWDGKIWIGIVSIDSGLATLYSILLYNYLPAALPQ